ncbi:MAG TPA: hypothetical protein PKK48_01675, partial [Phycisphaerae bacterium]|nr:hypothetical protein [Phycisphaerae bacterium]
KWIMATLIFQRDSRAANEKGISHTDFAELRRRMENPASFDEEFRQRLEVLAERLTAVQALGDEFRRVDLSATARKLLDAR